VKGIAYNLNRRFFNPPENIIFLLTSKLDFDTPATAGLAESRAAGKYGGGRFGDVDYPAAPAMFRETEASTKILNQSTKGGKHGRNRKDTVCA
jgi:hypothetical protein